MSVLLGDLGPLFASSLMYEVLLCIAFTALVVVSSCTQHTVEGSDMADKEHDTLSHGLRLIGTP